MHLAQKMERNREHFRAIIFTTFNNSELSSIFGDEAPSGTSVYRWYAEFNRGGTSA